MLKDYPCVMDCIFRFSAKAVGLLSTLLFHGFWICFWSDRAWDVFIISFLELRDHGEA